MQQEIQRYANSLWRSHDAVRPECLYHYTSLEGCRNIVGTGHIWASEARSMSTDAIDGIYGIDVIQTVLGRSEYSQLGPLRSWFQSPRLPILQNWLYLACLSRTRKIPSQWTQYAQDGTGCALELDFKVLIDGCDGGRQYALFRMDYEVCDQKRRVRKILDRAASLTLRTGSTSPTTDWGNVAFELVKCTARFKGRSYSNEEEWRIQLADPTRCNAKLRFSTDGENIYYRCIPVRRAITRVIRGRNCRLSLQELQETISSKSFLPVDVIEAD